MDFQTLTYELADDIAVITLNRPDKMNALTTQMRAELTYAITDGGKSARVLVLTGAGRAFCGGQGAVPAGVGNARPARPIRVL